MDRLMATLAETARRRARMRRIRAASMLREALPEDVVVSEGDEAITIEGRRVGMRWLRDPGFAMLRDLVGWLR